MTKMHLTTNPVATLELSSVDRDYNIFTRGSLTANTANPFEAIRAVINIQTGADICYIRSTQMTLLRLNKQEK